MTPGALSHKHQVRYNKPALFFCFFLTFFSTTRMKLVYPSRPNLRPSFFSSASRFRDANFARRYETASSMCEGMLMEIVKKARAHSSGKHLAVWCCIGEMMLHRRRRSRKSFSAKSRDRCHDWTEIRRFYGGVCRNAGMTILYVARHFLSYSILFSLPLPSFFRVAHASIIDTCRVLRSHSSRSRIGKRCSLPAVSSEDQQSCEQIKIRKNSDRTPHRKHIPKNSEKTRYRREKHMRVKSTCQR